MRFPLPILKKPEGDVQNVVAYTPQDQLEAQYAVEEARREADEENRRRDKAQDRKDRIKDNEELSKKERRIRAREFEGNIKEQAKRAKLLRKESDDRIKKEKMDELKKQSDIFSNAFRSGPLGKLIYHYQNSEEYLKNAVEAIKDRSKDIFLGKTLEDQKKELDGYVRNSLFQRAVTGEKYSEPKERDEPLSADDEAPAPASVPSDDNPVEAAKPGEPIQFPDKINVGEDDTALTKQIPVLQQIADAVGGLFDAFKKFTDSYNQENVDEERKSNAEGIKAKLAGAKDSAVQVVKKAGGWISGLLNDFGIWTIVGTNALIATLKNTVISALGATGRMIVKAFPIAALATGLFLAVKDAVGGWFSADAWGVSKISGMVGGLIGGLNDGVMGMLANAGKWALIGAGIGSFVPVVGTLLGGLIGGVFGGIMGYFGGEKIAQVVQGAADWAWDKFNKVVDSIKWFFTELPIKVAEFIQSTFDEVVKWGKEKIDSIKNSIHDFMNSIENYFKGFFTLNYWLGKEGVAQANPPKIESSMDDVKTLDGEGPDGKPVKVEIEPSHEFDDLLKSMDDFSKNIESSPRAEAKEAIAQKIYDQSIQNSTTNNNSTANDYSRTTNQSVVSGSFNKASINITGQPNPRNQEGSSFGTRSLLNGGFGNPSRF